MAHRVFNFNPGPGTLPLEVLQQVQKELLDYKGTGMSIMESSHRSPEYDEINNNTMALVHELLGLGDDYKVVFLGGGASTQFIMVPLNLLLEGQTAAYVDTGSWSSNAIKEAKLVGNVHVAGSSKEQKYSHIPRMSEISFPDDAAYLHITSNNTIFGTQYHEFPRTGRVPLVCDMSSDIASRRLDFTRFSLIYAGAQKNLGPAGVTLVVIKKDLLAKSPGTLPTMLNYNTHADKDSLFNTPPAFCVYVLGLVLQWIKKQGGLEAVEKVNFAKKERIYQLVDLHPDYFRGTVEPDSRSWMNLTMRLPSEDLEKKFLSEAKAAGFLGLKGHRSVGGIRVSLYNALPLDGAEKLAAF
ncbi:MAG: 3-phosphoserine/phosphohydroxythreonine transaminase, partial [candidate division Zixibacteria bacterium]|nr:3-phosphoserine/phosphohydroxythreonine transaminase [candidate division Zixibacteria bacterium]